MRGLLVAAVAADNGAGSTLDNRSATTRAGISAFGRHTTVPRVEVVIDYIEENNITEYSQLKNAPADIQLVMAYPTSREKIIKLLASKTPQHAAGKDTPGGTQRRAQL